MKTIEQLTEAFKHFPGIGPRQAKRFVYFILTKDKKYLDDLLALIEKVKSEMKICDNCRRYFSADKNTICSICADKNRRQDLLMVVAKDVDLEIIEKSHIYDGLYFVLGGLIPMIEQSNQEINRLTRLIERVNRALTDGLTEIILAMNANPDGEHTNDVLIKSLEPITTKHKVKISKLGRGLSTGTELEYSDSETIRNALKNRL